jgi:hypothetical protein
MKLIEARDSDVTVFRRSCEGDQIERVTCRPIRDGRPAPRHERRESWAFFLEGETPIGWVTLFDFNPRNRSAKLGYGLVPAVRGRGIGTLRMVDQSAHGERLAHYDLRYDARCDPAQVVGLAAVMAEGVLVEIGLQVLERTTRPRACLEASPSRARSSSGSSGRRRSRADQPWPALSPRATAHPGSCRCSRRVRP